QGCILTSEHTSQIDISPFMDKEVHNIFIPFGSCKMLQRRCLLHQACNIYHGGRNILN
uniref:Uncharacterized protein n=1 Tax=Aegilops tauschii subsp. strangulata TaxID=200361 RepID=A0A453R9M1_AEGTS